MSAVLVGSFRDLVIEGSWFINQSAITAEKCENRDKPEIQCNGKCYLKKQLANEQDQRKQQIIDLNKFSFQWIAQHNETPLHYLLSVALVYSPYHFTPSTGGMDPPYLPPQYF
jgi:hypothetical protein